VKLVLLKSINITAKIAFQVKSYCANGVVAEDEQLIYRFS